MRKFFVTIFVVMACAASAYASGLTVVRENGGDINSQIQENLTPVSKCTEISPESFNKNTILYLGSYAREHCREQIRKLLRNHKHCLSIDTIYTTTTPGNTDTVLYCSENPNIKITHTNDQTLNWSYAQKKCVGSSGEWVNNECICDQQKLPGTESQNNECICTGDPNQKYFNKIFTGCKTPKEGVTLARDGSRAFLGLLDDDGDIANIDKKNSCSITGGNETDDNRCACNISLNLQPNSTEYYCECVEGTDYKNPLYKSDGCVPIAEIPDYEGTVNDNNTSKQGSTPADKKTDEDIPTPTNTETEASTTSNTNTSNELSEKLKSARDALTAAKEKENSWANRALGATTTATTSLGAMQLAEGIAEKKADEEAEKEMRQYITTMKCEYGGGEQVNLGDEQTLPGGNELLEYYTEYKTLADNLKTTKAALGLSAGIESEVLYDRAQSGLYQYASTGKTGGGETSLFRALTDSESEDAAAWAEQKDASDKKLKTGGLVAAAGVATGVIGNYLINGRNEKQEKLKEEFTKKTKEVENKYSNDVLIRPQTTSLGANLGGFNTNLPTFTPSQTQDAEQQVTTQPEPVQNKLTSLNIKDKSLFPKGGYTIDPDNELLNSYAGNIKEVLNKEEYKDVNIEISIVGHTDKMPVRKIKGRPYQNNQELSELRAAEVEKYLQNKLSTLESRVTYSHQGKGETECTKDGDQQECRRVEITAKDTTNYSE